MKEKPILFSAPMVRAILEGRKTQTRRIVKNAHIITCDDRTGATDAKCPYPVGTRLWVRESFYWNGGAWCYRADMGSESARGIRWRSSIHMPREASRIDLEVTGVRVELVQEISPVDALAEGWDGAAKLAGCGCKGDDANCCQYRNVTKGDLIAAGVDDGDSAIEWYADLWDAINGKGSWDSNPWVWVYEFRRVKP